MFVGTAQTSKIQQGREEGNSWLLSARRLLVLTTDYQWGLSVPLNHTRRNGNNSNTVDQIGNLHVPRLCPARENVISNLRDLMHTFSPPLPLPLAAGSGSCRTFLGLHSALTSWRPSHCPTSKYITWNLLPPFICFSLSLELLPPVLSHTIILLCKLMHIFWNIYLFY